MSTTKVVLPAIAAALLLVALAWPQLKPGEDRFQLDIAAIGLASGGKPLVLNPRLLGIDEQARPFQITADIGSRLDDKGGLEVYQLDEPKADIILQDGSWVALTATDGVFERVGQMLYLSGGVNLFHDSGYEFATPSARVNLTERSAEGDEAIHGQGPFGIIDAEGFRVINRGEVILFTGKAVLTIKPAGGVVQ
ncbi:MAG: LPS export ABC transporter periplasmic protein LptC [Alphaproteobacteria bacterium]